MCPNTGRLLPAMIECSITAPRRSRFPIIDTTLHNSAHYELQSASTNGLFLLLKDLRYSPRTPLHSANHSFQQGAQHTYWSQTAAFAQPTQNKNTQRPCFVQYLDRTAYPLPASGYRGSLSSLQRNDTLPDNCPAEPDLYSKIELRYHSRPPHPAHTIF